MAWFSRNHTGRALWDYERQFLAAVVDLLDRVGAPQIEESETALTAEGDNCLVILIPHRALGGVSIVVWLDTDVAQVIWAQVAALDCCHDSLDLGIGVGRFRFRSFWSRVLDFSGVLNCIHSLITEPVTIRCYGDDRATILVRDDKGTLCEVGEIAEAARTGAVRPRGVFREVLIRLTDSESPPVTAPSGVDEWFGSERKGG